MNRKLSRGPAGFTLVEIMIVVAIIALLAAIAVPGFLRARKRSQASRIINDLRLIDSAVDQYAIENSKSTGNDILGNAYGAQMVDSLPGVPSASKTALSDVTDNAFWSPYN